MADIPRTGHLNILSGSLFGALFMLLTGVGAFYAWRAWGDPSEGISVAARSGSLEVLPALADPLSDPARTGVLYQNARYGFQMLLPSGWTPQDSALDAQRVAFDTATAHAERPAAGADPFLSASLVLAPFDRDALSAAYTTAQKDTNANVSGAFSEEHDVLIGTQLFHQLRFAGTASDGSGVRWYYVVSPSPNPSYAFSVTDEQKSVLLSMLRSFEPLKKDETSVSLLKAAALAYLRPTDVGGFAVVAVQEDGNDLRETLRFTLPAQENGKKILAADVDVSRTKLVYAMSDTVHVRNLGEGTEESLFTLGVSGAPDASFPLSSVKFSPDGTHLAVITRDGSHARLSVWDVSSRTFSLKDLSLQRGLILWVSAQQFLALSETGVPTLYDTNGEHVTPVQSAFFAQNKEARVYAAAFSADRSSLAFLVVAPAAPGEKAPAGERHVFLQLIDPHLSEPGKDKMLVSVDLGLVVSTEQEREEQFGLAFSPNAQRLLLSFRDHTWVAGTGRLETFRPSLSVDPIGRVLDTTPSGRMIVIQHAQDVAGHVLGERLRVFDPEGEHLLYTSALVDQTSLFSHF